MTTAERREQILSLINSSDSIKSSELASILNVTTETIRKDLIYLDNRHLIQKFHGYAKPITEAKERSIHQRISEHTSIKQAIARKALDYLKNCSVIFIDAGSTLCEFAKLLKEIASSDPAFSQFVIITNSFSIANALLGSWNTIYFIGGEINSTTESTSGFWASSELNSIKIDVAFLGSSGFASHNGPCTKIGYDALFKAEVVKNANKTIVLADHSKFSTSAIMQYASWSDIDLLITDCAVSEEGLLEVQEKVDIIIADPSSDL